MNQSLSALLTPSQTFQREVAQPIIDFLRFASRNGQSVDRQQLQDFIRRLPNTRGLFRSFTNNSTVTFTPRVGNTPSRVNINFDLQLIRDLKLDVRNLKRDSTLLNLASAISPEVARGTTVLDLSVKALADLQERHAIKFEIELRDFENSQGARSSLLLPENAYVGGIVNTSINNLNAVPGATQRAGVARTLLQPSTLRLDAGARISPRPNVMSGGVYRIDDDNGAGKKSSNYLDQVKAAIIPL